MIPTFFGISLVIFLVLNLAPGRPGAQQNAESTSDLRNTTTQESYRIFREQFALDKPTLFNLRFTLTQEDVARRVRALSPHVEEPGLTRSQAVDDLEDYGAFAVPHL